MIASCNSDSGPWTTTWTLEELQFTYQANPIYLAAYREARAALAGSTQGGLTAGHGFPRRQPHQETQGTWHVRPVCPGERFPVFLCADSSTFPSPGVPAPFKESYSSQKRPEIVRFQGVFL